MDNNKLKLRVSRMFRSSFGSCRSKTTPDVIQQPFFFPQNRQHYQLIDLFSPKPKPFPSICRPKWKEMVQEKDEGCVRHKVSDRNSLVSVRTDGRKYPHASPIISPPLDTKPKLNPKQRRSKKSNRKRKNTHSCEFNSAIEANYYGLYSSDDDDEYDDETTLFSSKSLSSDSSGSLRRTARRRNESGKARRRALGKKHNEVNLTAVEVKVSKSLSSDSSESFREKGNESGKARARAVGKKQQREREADVMTMEGKVKDSFAVVKRSSDPYNDFRTSMVEMIIERQIFGGKDLEDLLQCFLSLNSQCHHRVIVEVFTEIWETLFSDWC